ncbi:MAG: hypothetical protein ACREIT_03930 [Tepidisphaeraceae bacterium]
MSSVVVLLVAMCAGPWACSRPIGANIVLRKENQTLRDKVANLERGQMGDAATIAALERNATTVPVLANNRIEELFTPVSLKLGRLTGGADLDRSRPGDEGIKVYVVPVDADGDVLKAAGSFVVEAFDLSAPQGEVRVGRWEFPLADAVARWHGKAMLYEYVLTCPWRDGVPRGSKLTIKTTFTDALTRRELVAKTDVKINPPPTTPTTVPTTAPVGGALTGP